MFPSAPVSFPFSTWRAPCCPKGVESSTEGASETAGSVSAGCAPDASEDDVCSEEAVLSEMVSVMAADASGEADVAASFGVSCLPQPARAQVPKVASTAQLSIFLKIDIITSFLIRVRESTNENTNNGLPFKTKKQALTTNIIIVSVKLGKK